MWEESGLPALQAVFATTEDYGEGNFILIQGGKRYVTPLSCVAGD